MRVPQVSERIKEAPAQALRGVFAGIGQLLLITDKLRNKTQADQDVRRARTSGASETVTTVASPASQREEPAAAAAEPALAEPAASGSAAAEAVAAESAAPKPADRQARPGQARDRQARHQADRQADHGQAEPGPASDRQGGSGQACCHRAAYATQAPEHQGLRQDRQRSAAR